MRYGAVIAAADLSPRMKQFRQQLKIGSRGIAERVVVNFRRSGVEELVMVTGSSTESLEKAFKNFDVRFVRNEEYETTQMAGSVRLGLEALEGRCDRVFFCPVEVPFFSDRTILDEIAAMDRDPSANVIVPVCKGKEGYPLLIRGDAVETLLAHDECAVENLFESLPPGSVLRIPVDDEGTVIDPGAEEDYLRLLDQYNERVLHPMIRVKIASTSVFLGPGTVKLLKQIEKCGNVREACEKCGFSYSKGWKLIRNCEEKFGYSIVERQPGGQTGGSARVTEKGRTLLAVYGELETELSELAEKKFRELMKKYQLTGESK